MDKYILSIWKNHNDAKQWFYDICPMEQYFRNSFNYLIEYKKPYYYTAIFTGSQEECSKMANELKAQYCEKDNTEDL